MFACSEERERDFSLREKSMLVEEGGGVVRRDRVVVALRYNISMRLHVLNSVAGGRRQGDVQGGLRGGC